MEPHFATARLCDRHAERVQVARPGLVHYGERRRFFGQIATLKVFEDGQLVHDAAAAPGFHRVLVVDGEASLRCALLGSHVATRAVKMHWAGIVINGAVRDVADLRALDIGILALGASPRPAVQRGEGTHAIPLSFLDIAFRPGEWLYADEDGLVVSPDHLT